MTSITINNWFPREQPGPIAEVSQPADELDHNEPWKPLPASEEGWEDPDKLMWSDEGTELSQMSTPRGTPRSSRQPGQWPDLQQDTHHQVQEQREIELFCDNVEKG